LLQTLCDGVLLWGEKVVFTGEVDGTLPARIQEALREYLAERPSQFLVVQPLQAERPGQPSKPARAALVMECYERPADTAPMLRQMDMVAQHAASALRNAAEYRRIPLRFLWQSLADVREGLLESPPWVPTLILLGLGLLLILIIGLFGPPPPTR
jgi:hypothetical protein